MKRNWPYIFTRVGGILRHELLNSSQDELSILEKAYPQCFSDEKVRFQAPSLAIYFGMINTKQNRIQACKDMGLKFEVISCVGRPQKEGIYGLPVVIEESVVPTETGGKSDLFLKSILKMGDYIKQEDDFWTVVYSECVLLDNCDNYMQSIVIVCDKSVRELLAFG